MWGVGANFLNKMNEKKEFELRNINQKFQKLENTIFLGFFQ